MPWPELALGVRGEIWVGRGAGVRRALTLSWKGLTVDLDLDPGPSQTAVSLELSGERYSTTSLGTLF